LIMGNFPEAMSSLSGIMLSANHFYKFQLAT
jgi:hypothetical protein